MTLVVPGQRLRGVVPGGVTVLRRLWVVAWWGTDRWNFLVTVRRSWRCCRPSLMRKISSLMTRSGPWRTSQFRNQPQRVKSSRFRLGCRRQSIGVQAVLLLLSLWFTALPFLTVSVTRLFQRLIGRWTLFKIRRGNGRQILSKIRVSVRRLVPYFPFRSGGRGNIRPSTVRAQRLILFGLILSKVIRKCLRQNPFADSMLLVVRVRPRKNPPFAVGQIRGRQILKFLKAGVV